MDHDEGPAFCVHSTFFSFAGRTYLRASRADRGVDAAHRHNGLNGRPTIVGGSMPVGIPLRTNHAMLRNLAARLTACIAG